MRVVRTWQRIHARTRDGKCNTVSYRLRDMAAIAASSRDLEQATKQEPAALRCGLDGTGWNSPACAQVTGATYTEADRAANKPFPFDVARAHKLYKALFGAAEDLIKGKQLLLVPSGPLTQLPFQVLVTLPPSNSDLKTVQWLARNHALTVLPAVSSLKALRRVARPSGATLPMIGFGNPLLDGPDARYAQLAQRARAKQRCPEEGWCRWPPCPACAAAGSHR